MSVASDLGQLLRQRELAAYEERMARAAYAYGVDLRRSAWLSSSQVARPLVAGVARAWPDLVASLESEVLRPSRDVPADLLRDVAAAAERLRTPMPAVRILRPSAAFPGICPLGTLHGSAAWLVVDADAIGELGSKVRSFVLGHALGHLQCDHGIWFTAHLSAGARRARLWTTRRLFGPFVEVGVFSADRAGYLLALEPSAAEAGIEWIERTGARVPWWPRFPRVDLRLDALADFDRSVVVTAARRRGVGADGPDGTEAKPRDALPGWSLARCDARLTRRLGLL